MSLKSLTLFLTISCLVAMATPSAAQIPDEMQFAVDPGAAPLWIAMDEGSGRMPWGSLPPGRERMLRRHSEANQRPAPPGASGFCRQVLEKPDSSGVLVPESFADLVDKALAIVRGTVAETRQGFFDGVPFTLLLLRNPEVLKTQEDLDFAVAYVAYPRAAFRVGGDAFCTADAAFPKLPALGDELLVFSLTKPRDLAGRTLEPESFELIVERQSGALEVPSDFRVELRQAGTLDEVVSLVSELRDGEP